MGLDLRLLPVDHCDLSGKLAFSQQLLSLERRRDLFEAILTTSHEGGIAAPNFFNSYLYYDARCETSRYGPTTHDAYGEPLRLLPVRFLLQFKEHPGVAEAPKNRAAWSYLEALGDPERLVGLYWC